MEILAALTFTGCWLVTVMIFPLGIGQWSDAMVTMGIFISGYHIFVSYMSLGRTYIDCLYAWSCGTTQGQLWWPGGAMIP